MDDQAAVLDQQQAAPPPPQPLDLSAGMEPKQPPVAPAQAAPTQTAPAAPIDLSAGMEPKTAESAPSKPQLTMPTITGEAVPAGPAARLVGNFEAGLGLPPGTLPQYLDTIGIGAKQIAKHPIESAGALTDAMITQPAVDQYQKAIEAYRSGNYTEALARGIYGTVPMAGPILGHIADQLNSGDVAGAAGTTLAVVAPVLGEHFAPEIAERVPSSAGTKALREATAEKTGVKPANTPDSITTKQELFKKAIPPTKAAPYSDEDFVKAYPYLKEQHLVEDATTPVGIYKAADNAVEGLENRVAGMIDKAPAGTTIKSNPIADVSAELQKHPKIGFYNAGMRELENYKIGFERSGADIEKGEIDPPNTLKRMDDLRHTLNQENKGFLKANSMDTYTALQTNPAFAARYYLADSLRNGLYDQLEDLGIKSEGVDARQLRGDEGSLLKVKSASWRQELNGEKQVPGTGKPKTLPRTIGAAGTRAGGMVAGGTVGSIFGPIGSSVGAVTGRALVEPIARMIEGGENLTRNAILDKVFNPETPETSKAPAAPVATVGQPPMKVAEPTVTGGNFSGALNEGSKAANTPDWVAGEFSHEIDRLEKIVRNPESTAEEKAIAGHQLQHTRELAEHIANPNQGAAEVAPASKLNFAASKAGLEYKGPLEGGNGQVFHTFDDPTKPGDQITIRESELPATGVADFLKQRMDEKRATTESLRQDVLNRVKGEVGQPQLKSENVDKLVSHINGRDWWHVPPEDPNAYSQRGKFLSSSFKDAEFYGRPLDQPQKTSIKNPLIGDEDQISKTLGLPAQHSDMSLEEIAAHDKKWAQAAKDQGYDSIAVLSPKGWKEFQTSGKIPRSIELNTLEDVPSKTIGQPQAKLLEAPIPKKYAKQGFTTQSAINHELGHSIVGDAVGMEPGEIRTHLHPSTIEQGAIAQAAMDYTPVGGEGEKITYEDARPVFVDKFVPMFYAGGIAQELLDGIPVSANAGMFGDVQAIHQAMESMGFNNEAIALAKQLGEAQARKILTKPGVLDTIRKYSATREDGLPETLHMSKERVQQMLKEIRGEKNVESQSSSGSNGKIVQKLDSGAAGKVSEGNGSNDEIKAPKFAVGKSVTKSEAQPRNPNVSAAAGLSALASSKVVPGKSAQPETEEESEAEPLDLSAGMEAKEQDIPALLSKASKDYGVPEDLLYAQAMQESKMNPNAESNKGAKGVMQLMDQTSRSLGVTDPKDPAQNVDGGARLMKQLLDRFNGDQEKALASYDWNPTSVDKAVQEHGHSWLSYTPKETQTYVRKIMSEKYKQK